MQLVIQQMDLDSFHSRFSSEEECLKFLAGEKWKDGFVCRKCGSTNFCHGKTPFSKRCTRCKHEESARAHTIFHRCHIPITEAFHMVYLVCHDPKISSYELSRKIDLRQMTCWKLKSKLMECINQRGKIEVLFDLQRP